MICASKEYYELLRVRYGTCEPVGKLFRVVWDTNFSLIYGPDHLYELVKNKKVYLVDNDFFKELYDGLL